MPVQAQTLPSATSPGYEALRTSAAWVDLSSRGKIIATGDDRARLLHAMLTNHIQQLQPGEGCYAFFLNAQGRILSDVNVFCRTEDFLLDVEPETRQLVYEHLDKYIIADDVTLTDVTDRTATIDLEGPQAHEFAKRLEIPVPEKAWAHTLWNDIVVANVTFTGAPALRFFAPLEQKSRIVEQFQNAGAPKPARKPHAWSVSNISSRATVKKFSEPRSRRKRSRCTRSTSARAVTWARKLWSACARAAWCTGCS